VTPVVLSGVSKEFTFFFFWLPWKSTPTDGQGCGLGPLSSTVKNYLPNTHLYVILLSSSWPSMSKCFRTQTLHILLLPPFSLPSQPPVFTTVNIIFTHYTQYLKVFFFCIPARFQSSAAR
jgi:hypothetical protein